LDYVAERMRDTRVADRRAARERETAGNCLIFRERERERVVVVDNKVGGREIARIIERIKRIKHQTFTTTVLEICINVCPELYKYV